MYIVLLHPYVYRRLGVKLGVPAVGLARHGASGVAECLGSLNEFINEGTNAHNKTCTCPAWRDCYAKRLGVSASNREQGEMAQVFCDCEPCGVAATCGYNPRNNFIILYPCLCVCGCVRMCVSVCTYTCACGCGCEPSAVGRSVGRSGNIMRLRRVGEGPSLPLVAKRGSHRNKKSPNRTASRRRS